MVPRKRSAAMKVVPIMLREVEYVGDMGQSEPFRLADMKDVPTMQRREEFASDMVQKLRLRLAIMKDAQIKLSREGYVGDMEPSKNVVIGGVAIMHLKLVFFVGDTEQR